MPRNEFMNHDILEGLTDLQIQEKLKNGECTVNDVRRHRGLPPAPSREEAEEDLSQEVDPVEDDPHQWPSSTVGDLRRGPGDTTSALIRKTAT